MALQRLGEHSSSVVWHVNGSHTRVWAKHTHSLKLENFLQPQDFFPPVTPKHTIFKDIGLEWGGLSKWPSSTFIIPLIIVIGTDPPGRPRAWISCPDWLRAWSRTARGWLWEAERCSTPLLHPPTRGSYALCPDTHTHTHKHNNQLTNVLSIYTHTGKEDRVCQWHSWVTIFILEIHVKGSVRLLSCKNHFNNVF